MSYGNDMDIGDNPLECGFDRYVNLETDVMFLGKESLKKIKKDGIKKKLMGVKIDAQSIILTKSLPLTHNNEKVGEIRSSAFSPKFGKVVGIAMIKKEFCKNLQKFQLVFDNKIYKGEVCDLPIN